MKKLILAILAAGAFANANAQEPHSILLYGNAGITTTRADDQSKTTNWNATPGVGYQFNHNWTVGLQLMWGQNATKSGTGTSYNPVTGAAQTQGTKNTFNNYSAGAFARYSKYIGKSETFFWFSQFDVDYAGGYHTNEGSPADAKHTGIALDLYPAIGANVGHGLALNFSVGGIGYGSQKYADDVTINGVFHSGAYANNTFNLTFGQSVNIGLSKNFNCGHKMHSNHEPGDEVHRRKADKMEDEDDAAPKPKKKERNRDDDE
jgi:hypothetical protein